MAAAIPLGTKLLARGKAARGRKDTEEKLEALSLVDRIPLGLECILSGLSHRNRGSQLYLYQHCLRLSFPNFSCSLIVDHSAFCIHLSYPTKASTPQ